MTSEWGRGSGVKMPLSVIDYGGGMIMSGVRY